MKSLTDTIETILIALFSLCMVFLFIGEPDLWDKAHAAAMTTTETPCKKP